MVPENIKDRVAIVTGAAQGMGKAVADLLAQEGAKVVLNDVRESGGTAVSVSDEEIQKAQHKLAAGEGIFACPEGAATLAGLVKLLKNNWLQGNERVVLFNTGTGLKYIY